MCDLDGDFRIHRTALQAASDALPPNAIVGGLLAFPAGDGYAFYRVVTEQPLTVQLVLCGDAWEVQVARIHGLTRANVVEEIGRARRFKALSNRGG